MNTQQLKELRNALSCWQEDYDRDDDKEQYDMFGAAIDAVSRLEKAERERDELHAIAEGQSELAGRNAARAQKAEAEIARRDAAAGEPVAWISERNLANLGKQFSVTVKHEPVMVRPVPLYTAPPPAVVSDDALREVIRTWQKADFPSPEVFNQMREVIGAQPQNPVVLPDLCVGVVQDGHAVMVPYKSGHWFNKTAVLEALDAANVKWELKP